MTNSSIKVQPIFVVCSSILSGVPSWSSDITLLKTIGFFRQHSFEGNFGTQHNKIYFKTSPFYQYVTLLN